VKRELATARATRAAGAELARALIADASREPWLIGLTGELGAGKTTFVAGFLRALRHAGAVRSPTFTFVEPYRLAGRDIHHCDLYRINDPRDIDDLGLRDLLTRDGVLLVEWPHRAAGRLGAFDLTVQLEYAQHDDGSGRRLHLAADSPRGAALIARLSR
jgi:tRNA threonylcarbamoyladenosine biosynthesis protein TsaE